MTYALVLIKGKSSQRESSLSLLENLAKDSEFSKATGVKIEKVFVSFGWPDIILLIRSANVELIKNAIVELREKLSKNGDDADTSTIICTTTNEMKKKRRKWGKLGETSQKP
jgi:hypothetical protein